MLAAPRIADDFAEALAEQARGTKTGMPDDADVLYGPLNNANQLERVGGISTGCPTMLRCWPAAPGRASGATSGSPPL